MINGYYKDVLSFKFKEFVANESLKVMKELSSNKVSVLKKTPIKIIKNSAQIYSSTLTQIFKSLCLYCKFFRSSQIHWCNQRIKKDDVTGKL